MLSLCIHVVLWTQLHTSIAIVYTKWYLCVQGGIYVVELIDKFTLAFPLLIVVLLEVLVISYIYGNYCIFMLAHASGIVSFYNSYFLCCLLFTLFLGRDIFIVGCHKQCSLLPCMWNSLLYVTCDVKRCSLTNSLHCIYAYCEARALSYQVVKTACCYNFQLISVQWLIDKIF